MRPGRTPALVALLIAVAASPAAAATGDVFTVAGAGHLAASGRALPIPLGDGGAAALARVDYPTGVAALPDGGYLIADAEGQRVRQVSPRGVITTVAGTGRSGLDGDGGAATAARLDWPVGAAPLADGAIAIADQRNNRVRVVDRAGTITTLAQVTSPDGVAAATDGGVLVVQGFENRVLHIDRAGVVTVAAGTGVRGFAGDGGPATAARLSRPAGVAPAIDGGYLIADGSNRIRRVAPDGAITTAVQIDRPAAVAQAGDGSLYVASVNQIRRVSPGGAVTVVAGTGRGNFSGDGGPAADANLWLPRGVALPGGGGIVVADTGSGRVRFIDTAAPGVQVPGIPRMNAASFRRPIQVGEAGIATHIRVACPPRGVAVRFGLARAATVSVVVTRAGRTVARPGARLPAGAGVLRFRVSLPGRYLVRLTAVDRLGRPADDQAQLTVNTCG